MWLASMWLGMLFEGPSFPHTLQIASLFRPSLLRTFARVIMDLICLSRSAGAALIVVFEIATISTGFVDACPYPFASIFFLSRKISAFIGAFATLSVLSSALPPGC